MLTFDARLALVAACVLLGACHRWGAKDSSDSGTPGDSGNPETVVPWTSGDASSLAHSQGNSMGLYDLALCPAEDEVFFSNLHYPGIGVVSLQDGAFVEVIDLSPATDGRASRFPFVACDPARSVLYVNIREQGALLRIDASTHTLLDTVPVCGETGWVEVDRQQDEVLVACDDTGTIVRLDGETLAVLGELEVGGDIMTTATLDTWLYVVDDKADRLQVFDRQSGEQLADLQVPGRPNQLAVWEDGSSFLTVRESGRVQVLAPGAELTALQSVTAGSDTFGITAVPDWGLLAVVARQGAEVPQGATYMGDPGLVYGLDPTTLQMRWSAEVGKTAHFPLYHAATDRLVVGNEDSMDISAVGPLGQPLWTSPNLGLSLDDVVVDAKTGRMWFPSHLTDELWVADWRTGEKTALDAPWWPFAVELDEAGRRVYAAAQERALLYAYDADSLDLVQQWDLGVDSHQLPCSPLCAGHITAVDLALDVDRGLAWIAHPPNASVLRLNLASGAVDEISTGTVSAAVATIYQHMALAADPNTGRLYAYYNVSDRLVAIDGDEVVASVQVDSEAARPLGLDPMRGRVVLGRQVFDLDLQTVGELPGTGIYLGTLPDAGLVLLLEGDNLQAYDLDTLQPTGAIDAFDLPIPPFRIPNLNDGEEMLSPLDVRPTPDGLAVLINTFEAGAVIVDPRTW